MYNSKFVKPENKRGQYKCCSYQHCVLYWLGLPCYQ